MTTDDEFRAQAADAQKMADKAISEMDKEPWFRVAQGWLGLIRFSEPTVKSQSNSEKFDAQVTKDGTGQKDSESSH